MNTEQARVMLIGKTKIIQEQKEHSGFLRIELPGASARTEENVGIRGGQDQKNTVSASKYTIPNGEQSGPYADRELSEDDCYHIPTEDSRSSSDEISESTPLTTVSLRLQLKPRKQGKKEFLKDVKRCVNTTPKSKVCHEKDWEWKEDY
ncbi:hypothetical protein Zmor_002347 [Zophobas morio]|uniref:Uncharacterized protein n=1 Tax=Zophobas morio TaxID=2755281 RepID=A0AA38MTJ0_9CUCU|nr:hypothetical protein Zmor_002347 [Zophobas morio]